MKILSLRNKKRHLCSSLLLTVGFLKLKTACSYNVCLLICVYPKRGDVYIVSLVSQIQNKETPCYMPRSLRTATVPHYLALIRAGLGLTQEQLAGALGVSRHLVTKIEGGQRVLPASAGIILSWLAQALPPPGPPAPPVPLASTETAPLQARAAAVAHEIQQLTRRLERGQARSRRALDWLRAAPKLLEALAPEAERQRLWVAAITAQASGALQGDGSPALHRLLQARLAGLRAEAAALAGYLEPK
jgi:transcriptional regulator with XRE-family HTH domain